jgi:hypothetical protein
MRNLSLVGLSLLLLASTASSQLIAKVAGFGSLDFSVESGATSASYTQTVTSLNFNGSQSLGATLGGFWNPLTPKDWSSYPLTDFGLLVTLAGTNPSMPFTLEVYDSALQIANIFTGSTFGATSSPSFLSLTLSQIGSGNMNDIVGIQFTWDALDSVDIAIEGMGVVPEPSTVSLLVIGGCAILFRFLRKRLER